MLLKKIWVAALVASGMVGAANATPINATGSVVLAGINSVPAGTIGADTTFSFTFSLLNGRTGDLSGVPLTTLLTLGDIVTSAITATTGTAVGFSAAWGSFLGTVSTVEVLGPTTGRTVNISALGAFTPLAGPPDLTGFDPGQMTMTFSANQTGSGNLVSVSANYSIASVAVPTLPEPGSLALVGLGLLAAGGALRRRQAA